MAFYSFFFILSPFSLPLIRLHRKSELPFVCNGESRKGEGARSAAREKEWKRSRRRGRMRRVRRVAWEQRKATRRKMQRDGSASQPLLSASLSLPFFSPSPSTSLYCVSLSLSFPPPPSLPWTSSALPQSIFRLPIRRSKSLEEKRRRLRRPHRHRRRFLLRRSIVFGRNYLPSRVRDYPLFPTSLLIVLKLISVVCVIKYCAALRNSFVAKEARGITRNWHKRGPGPGPSWGQPVK